MAALRGGQGRGGLVALRPCFVALDFAGPDRRGVFRCFQIGVGHQFGYQWFSRQPRGQRALYVGSTSPSFKTVAAHAIGRLFRGCCKGLVAQSFRLLERAFDQTGNIGERHPLWG